MKRFRFSLLSLVVGVVLAGGVGYLNMRPSEFIEGSDPLIQTARLEYGWPFVACEWWWWEDYLWHWLALCANILVGLAIVFGGAGANEYVLRRREAVAGCQPG